MRRTGPDHRRLVRRLLLGAVFGWLCAVGLALLHIDTMLPWTGWLGEPLVLVPLASLAGLTRLRAVFLTLTLLVWLLIGAVVLTPLSQSLLPLVSRRDPPAPAPAVVVLSAGIASDGTPTPQAAARLEHAYNLLQDGLAPVLVLTHLPSPDPSYVPAATRRKKALGGKWKIVETGVAWNTYTEAVAVAALARQRGWREVLLVSDPTHLRRAAALFQKQGLAVRCSPCRPAAYEPQAVRTATERQAAFRDWLRETLLWHIMRARGWL